MWCGHSRSGPSITQHPSTTRSGSRLLRLSGETLADHRFAELPQLLSPDDLLVFNDTRGIKARLFGRKETGGRIEVLVERLDSIEQLRRQDGVDL